MMFVTSQRTMGTRRLKASRSGRDRVSACERRRIIRYWDAENRTAQRERLWNGGASPHFVG